MLDREEDAALAEIEAALRRDDPDFVQLLERMDSSDTLPAWRIEGTIELSAAPEEADGATGAGERRRRSVKVRRMVVAIAVVVAAVAVTLVAAVLLGPDAGGLVGVVALTAAGMIVYQRLRGCPGLRRRR